MRIYYFWISSCSFDRIEWIERERIKCWNSIKIDKTKYSECNVVVHRKSCWSTEEFSISSHTFENANRREQRKRICYFNMIYQRFAIEKCICILVLICSVRERERERHDSSGLPIVRFDFVCFFFFSQDFQRDLFHIIKVQIFLIKCRPILFSSLPIQHLHSHKVFLIFTLPDRTLYFRCSYKIQ